MRIAAGIVSVVLTVLGLFAAGSGRWDSHLSLSFLLAALVFAVLFHGGRRGPYDVP